jgi:adenosylcobinamide kinase/adenosylcobinamide-phosphate guanylyltransferase
MGTPLILVLGGTRSGKSSHGLRRIATLAGGRPVAYLATAIERPDRVDPELNERIARHRAARPLSWPTIEVGVDLPAAIRRAGDEVPILLDGLTLWLSAIVDRHMPANRSTAANGGIDLLLDGPIGAGLTAIDGHLGPIVVVSDEIGLGMVPMDPVARSFRDLQGIVHQRLAALADEVVLLVAGLPLDLKSAAARLTSE